MFNVLQVASHVNFFSNTDYTSIFTPQSTASGRYVSFFPVSCLMKKAQKIVEDSVLKQKAQLLMPA